MISGGVYCTTVRPMTDTTGGIITCGWVSWPPQQVKRVGYFVSQWTYFRVRDPTYCQNMYSVSSQFQTKTVCPLYQIQKSLPAGTISGIKIKIRNQCQNYMYLPLKRLYLFCSRSTTVLLQLIWGRLKVHSLSIPGMLCGTTASIEFGSRPVSVPAALCGPDWTRKFSFEWSLWLAGTHLPNHWFEFRESINGRPNDMMRCYKKWLMCSNRGVE